MPWLGSWLALEGVGKGGFSQGEKAHGRIVPQMEKRALIDGAPSTGGGVMMPSQADGLPSARGCPATAALSAAGPATVDA